MYIDGHEREDVVNYRDKFIQQWKEYEKRMVTFDIDGNIATIPTGFPVPGGKFQLILVTHDESTFYGNDQHKTKWIHQKTKWIHQKTKPMPEHKHEGQSLMVSDFLTSEWGYLKDDEE